MIIKLILSILRLLLVPDKDKTVDESEKDAILFMSLVISIFITPFILGTIIVGLALLVADFNNIPQLNGVFIAVVIFIVFMLLVIAIKKRLKFFSGKIANNRYDFGNFGFLIRLIVGTSLVFLAAIPAFLLGYFLRLAIAPS